MKKAEEAYGTLPEVYTRRQLNALYREIPLKDTTSRTLRKYFSAMANLYGVITLRKAYEIISSQSPRLVTEKEFLAFAEIARHEDSGYVILREDEIYSDGKKKSPFEWEIIDVLLVVDDFDPYSETKEYQQGKPFYIPDKQQLLLYADDAYCEETPEVTALLAFMETRLDLTEEQAHDTLPDIMFSSRYITDGINSAMRIFNHMQVTFKNDADMQRFTELYTEFHNTNRLQCNRGHTPEEMAQMVLREQRMPESTTLGPNIRQMIASGETDVADLRRQFMEMDLPDDRIRFSLLKELADVEKAMKAAAKPVGRNDPCPCGSGKKYKKCCGR